MRIRSNEREGLSYKEPAFNDAGMRNAFLWTESEGMRDLGQITGNFSQGTLINEQGHVAGTDGRSGFFWSPETGMIDLGTLPNATSIEPLAMNNLDQIVGWANINPVGLPSFVLDHHAFYLKVASPAQSAIEELIDFVDDLDLSKGRENSLVASLTNALEKVAQGNPGAAEGMLNAFINKVEAQRGESITEDDADAVAALAPEVLDELSGGCGQGPR